MPNYPRLMAAIVLTGVAQGSLPARAADTLRPSSGYSSVFADETAFAASGRTPYFVLVPGFVIVLEGVEDGEAVRDVQTVLKETVDIDGVTVGIIEDRESKGGQVAEVTRDYYAISKRTNSVYYFGEDVDEYKDGKVVGHGGAWRSGVNGARFGLIMPGLPLLGARYVQEIAPGVGMDQGEVVGIEERLTTPAGTFTHCLRTSDTSALEPGSTTDKVYAPGIGVIKDGSLVLTRSGFIAKNKP